MKEKCIPLLKELRDTYGRRVKYVRCDNAGENQALEKECVEKELGIVFEYTAPGTPQQNGVVERAFATMLGKTRAVMNGAGFDEKNDNCFGQKRRTRSHIWRILLLGREVLRRRIACFMEKTHYIQIIYKYLGNWESSKYCNRQIN